MAQQMPAGIPAGAQMPKTQEEAAAMQEKQSEMEDKRKMILNQVLTAEAQDRLGRIAVVKASYARQVEDTLIQQAMKGQLPGQIDDKALLGVAHHWMCPSSLPTLIANAIGRFSRNLTL